MIYYRRLDILFSSNQNVHKSLCGLYFLALDPLIDILGSGGQKITFFKDYIHSSNDKLLKVYPECGLVTSENSIGVYSLSILI